MSVVANCSLWLFVDDKLMAFLSIPQDLKQPYHLLNKKNNEELKRLTAVESLMEVSAEENVSLTRDTFGFHLFFVSIFSTAFRQCLFVYETSFQHTNRHLDKKKFSYIISHTSSTNILSLSLSFFPFTR